MTQPQNWLWEIIQNKTKILAYIHQYNSVSELVLKYPLPSTLSQYIVVFFCCWSGWWKCYCFIWLTALGGWEEDKSRLNKQRKQCSQNFWLEQGQKNTRIAETGNTVGETFLSGSGKSKICSSMKIASITSSLYLQLFTHLAGIY